MASPFLDESRDARIKLGVAGLADTLRAPESLHRLVMVEKPTTVSAGDFALKSMLDAALMARMLRGDYPGIQRLLGTLFGPVVDERHPSSSLTPDSAHAASGASARGTNGTAGDERHQRLAKAASR